MTTEATAAEATETTETTETAPEPVATPVTETTTEAASTPETTTEAAAEADWRASITDPGMAEFAKRIASPADAVKIAFDLRKANGSMIKVPGKDAKPEELATFRKALGVPETMNGYTFEMPEGVEPSETDKAFQVRMAEVFHETGVPAGTAMAMNKAWNEMTAAAEAEAARLAKQGFEDAQAGLKKELGAEYEPSRQVANRALQTFGGDELVSFLQDTVVNGHRLSDHPRIFKAFATIGRRMGEADFIGAVSQDEKSTIQGEIDQLMRDNPPGSPKYSDPKVQKRIRELSEQLHGTGSIVGSAGRAV